jgi:NAD(P)H-quinone oxidoreductase subunit I
MTEEYELSTFDRHSLNYDNIALGRLPTSVTSDPAVLPLRELAYLPKGAMDPHGVPDTAPRAGKLPEQVLETLPKAEPKASAQPTGDAS